MSTPILTVAQMRDWEQAAWAAGRTQPEVIRRAGEAVARCAESLTQTSETILVLAGRGNNGADARQAGAQCRDRRVHVVEVLDPGAGLGAVKSFVASTRPALIVDGLFGTGLNRALSLEWCALIEYINQLEVPVLAIDVPSGLAAESGEPQGAALRANVTLALGAIKAGLIQTAALPFTGRLLLAEDIGLGSCPFASEQEWTLPTDFWGYPVVRPLGGNKGTFGHLMIMAGSVGYHGAALLSARGALRARPGLVSLFPTENVYLPIASQMQAAMVHPWHSGMKYPDSLSAVLLGPGLAGDDVPEAMKAEARRIWRDLTLPVIADASALDWLVCGLSKVGATRVITPHPGEAARLLRTTAAKVQADRPAALRELSKRWGNCWVVLKGHQTLVGRSEGKLFVNSSGDSGLAQGGTGDVLAGYLGGLLAQPRLQAQPCAALRYAVWQHGRTAEHLSARAKCWGVEELVEKLGEAV